VSIAKQVLEEVGLDILICGMVKDDQHRTRGLLYEGQELSMKKTSEGFKLITRIQDEAHRFAIDYHKKLRNKKQIQSILDEIKGIGPARRKALVNHFGSVNNIKALSAEEIAEAPTMNKNLALNVYNFFHKVQKDENVKD